MDDDRSTGTRREPDDLDALSAPRRLSVDEHMLSVLAPSGHPSTCRLQLFTSAGARPVAVVTQVMGEGMGLTNAAEAFAGAVWERYCPDEELPPVWVQRHLDSGGTALSTGFQRVRFAKARPYRPQQPRWSTITAEQLEALVGARVDEDRGAGYVPRPEEPEPQLVFEAFAVVRLARPRPFRESQCMRAGVTWRQRWARQVLPRRGTRECCWYHGGDWHAVSAMALDVLKRARAQSVAPEEMGEYAVAHAAAAAAGVSRWQIEALASLFSVANAIQPARGPGYVNGQHRAQALLDAGVRRSVVLRMVWAP
ncbi:hypothetical protein ACFYPC_33815 [Streptomyces sp. NPDC005808]|uniref:hypothetical protein n=1 Tax=Streptomyces sp. NPDC005808 TaxID=3364734 RepID=UPI0036C50DFF